MRKLTPLSRRRFGQGLGAGLALTALPRKGAAHDGPHVVEVRMSDLAFVPDRLDIVVGDTVVWVNDDLAPHTATAIDGSWTTETLKRGDEARRDFQSPGDFEYVCAFHPHMTATVSVRPKPVG